MPWDFLKQPPGCNRDLKVEFDEMKAALKCEHEYTRLETLKKELEDRKNVLAAIRKFTEEEDKKFDLRIAAE